MTKVVEEKEVLDLYSQAFAKNVPDPHTWVAAMLYGVSEKEVLPEQRLSVKRIIFGAMGKELHRAIG